MGDKQGKLSKRQPHRTCVICREVRPKRQLVRLVYDPASGIRMDVSGKASGRGAYLCDKPQCWHDAQHSAKLAVALRVVLAPNELEAISALAPTDVHLSP